MLPREILQYWQPAALNLYRADNPMMDLSTMYNKLDEVLGVNLYRTAYIAHPDPREALPEEMKHLLTALAGPHGKTILRAYRIQKGLE